MRPRRSFLQSRTLMIDTGAYFALFDRDDVNHGQAVTIRNGLAAQGWRIVTTSFILAETHALLLNRLSHRAATQFLRDMEQTPTTLEWVTPADVERARAIIYQYTDKRFTLTDATSFAIMDRLNISYAFAFDGNFEQYGLTVLTPNHFSQR